MTTMVVLRIFLAEAADDGDRGTSGGGGGAGRGLRVDAAVVGSLLKSLYHTISIHSSPVHEVSGLLSIFSVRFASLIQLAERTNLV